MILSMWAGIESQLESLTDEDQERLVSEGLVFSGFYRGSSEAAFLDHIVNGTGEWSQFENRDLDGGAPNALAINRNLRREYDLILPDVLVPG